MELEEVEVEAWMVEPYHWLLAKWSWKKLGLDKVAGITYGCMISEGIQIIGVRCGGWTETENENTLKHHLHWARIKV